MVKLDTEKNRNAFVQGARAGDKSSSLPLCVWTLSASSMLFPLRKRVALVLPPRGAHLPLARAWGWPLPAAGAASESHPVSLPPHPPVHPGSVNPHPASVHRLDAASEPTRSTSVQSHHGTRDFNFILSPPMRLVIRRFAANFSIPPITPTRDTDCDRSTWQ